MEIKEHTATIFYCCDDVFKRLYGKYIRSIKRQYGRKLFHQANISCFETIRSQEYAESKTSRFLVKNCCKKCMKMLQSKYRKKHPMVTDLKKMNIHIRINNE